MNAGDHARRHRRVPEERTPDFVCRPRPPFERERGVEAHDPAWTVSMCATSRSSGGVKAKV